jgi:hypothetical protein
METNTRFCHAGPRHWWALVVKTAFVGGARVPARDLRRCTLRYVGDVDPGPKPERVAVLHVTLKDWTRCALHCVSMH